MYLMKEKTLSVKIPAGVEDENRIRLSEEGEAGARGGKAGDLYVYISIRKHQFFTRKTDDIHFEMPIKFTTAALGGSIEIPTIDGTKAKLQISEGSQNGDQLRLKSKGMSVINSGGRRGDMYVRINIETPVKLSSEERDLLTKLDKLMQSKSSNPESESFFKKVGDFFGFARLLLAKVVGWKTQHDQTLGRVIGVELFQAFVLGRETAKTRRVDHNQHLAGVLAEFLGLFILQSQKSVLEHGRAGELGLGAALRAGLAGQSHRKQGA